MTKPLTPLQHAALRHLAAGRRVGSLPPRTSPRTIEALTARGFLVWERADRPRVTLSGLAALAGA